MANRPMYETEGDLVKEAVFGERIAAFTRSKLVKLPIKYRVDFAALRSGKVVAFIEVKERTTAKEKYKDYQCSADKLMNGVLLSEMFGVPFTLFVRFSDVDTYILINRGLMTSCNLEILNLVSRGDPQDVEPCVSLPLDRLTTF